MTTTNATSNVFFRNGQGRLALINGRPAFHGMVLRVFDQDCTIVSARPQGVGFRYTVLTPEGKAVELNAKDVKAFGAKVKGEGNEVMFADKQDWVNRATAYAGIQIMESADGVSRAVFVEKNICVGEYGPCCHLFLESYVRDTLKLQEWAGAVDDEEQAEPIAPVEDVTDYDGTPMDPALVQAIDQTIAAGHALAQAIDQVIEAPVSFDGLDAWTIQRMAEYAGLDSVSPKYDELIRKEHPSEQERQLLCKKLKESGYVGIRKQAGRTFPVYKDDPSAKIAKAGKATLVAVFNEAAGITARTVPNAKTAGLKDRGDAVAVFLRSATSPAELRACLESAGFPDLDGVIAQYSHLSFGLLKMSMTNRLRKLVTTGTVAASAIRAS
jgi:hypothetical protein